MIDWIYLFYLFIIDLNQTTQLHTKQKMLKTVGIVNIIPTKIIYIIKTEELQIRGLLCYGLMEDDIDLFYKIFSWYLDVL